MGRRVLLRTALLSSMASTARGGDLRDCRGHPDYERLVCLAYPASLPGSGDLPAYPVAVCSNLALDFAVSLCRPRCDVGRPTALLVATLFDDAWAVIGR